VDVLKENTAVESSKKKTTDGENPSSSPLPLQAMFDLKEGKNARKERKKPPRIGEANSTQRKKKET